MYAAEARKCCSLHCSRSIRVHGFEFLLKSQNGRKIADLDLRHCSPYNRHALACSGEKVTVGCVKRQGRWGRFSDIHCPSIGSAGTVPVLV